MTDIDTSELPPEDELPEGPNGETLEYEGVRVPEDGEHYLTRGNRVATADERMVYYWVVLKPKEPTTEEFRVKVGNGQVLVISGPVRDIEPGEEFHYIVTRRLRKEAMVHLNCDGPDERLGGENPDAVRIPASEASLRIEGQDDPFCSPGSCDHCDDLREQWEADEDES